MSEGLAVLSFEVRQGEALHRQITRHIRALIFKGTLLSGTKLPRMHDLASHWNTNYFTVHTALTELVREGLLERKPRLGTFVRRQNRELRNVGIYFGDQILVTHERAFFRALHSQLLALLQKENISSRVFIDYRPHPTQNEPLPELAEAIASGAIQGLIVPLDSNGMGKWIHKMSIPTSLFGPRAESGRIWIDFEEMMTAACQALKERGCQTVSLISQTPLYEAPWNLAEGDGFLGAFRSCVKSAGLKTKEAWIRTPKVGKPILQEKFGYDQFRKLWALAEKPDGLIVYPDMTARGVVMAMLELRVKAPQDLKLVLHRNENVDFLCPIPADWIVTREKDVAQALLQQVKDRFNGIKPRSYKIHQAFKKGEV
jgi:DNA-binding LacI/PurR family transcriptional regulator